jgi:translation elongation factor EF-Tu-like GTPase
MFFKHSEAGVIPLSFNNYRPQFYFRTTDVTCVCNLPAGVECVCPETTIELDDDLITPHRLETECASPTAKADATFVPRRYRHQRVI